MDQLWLPKNLTWEQVEAQSKEYGIKFPIVSDLTPSLYYAALLVIAQILVKKAIRLALGIVGQRTGLVMAGSGRKENFLEKVTDTSWKLIYHTCILLYGACVLLPKPWIWNTDNYFTHFPFQKIDSDVKTYYLLEIGLYVSLLLTHFSGPKRKDFCMLVLHHVLTIALLTISWGINCVRVGSAIVFAHDAADVPLEVLKLGIYTKSKRVADYAFGIFAIVWIVTRLWIYPFHLIWSCVRHSSDNPNVAIGAYICIGMLGLIALLNFIWSYFIAQMALRRLSGDRKELQDSRSSDEEGEEQGNRMRKEM